MKDSEKKIDPEILSESVRQVGSISDKESVETAARMTGFVRRESAPTGHLFLTVFVLGMSIYGTPKLEQLIGLLHMAFPVISISRPGSHQRINEKAVTFFEFMLSEALRITVPPDYDPNVPDDFDRIIIDSTSFQLPESLAEVFAGSGGSASGAAVKIRFGYDPESFRFSYVVREGNRPGNCEQNSLSEEIMPGDLVIRDMGYLVARNLRDTHDKGAYYPSRSGQEPTYMRKMETVIIRNRILPKSSETEDNRSRNGKYG